MAPLAPLPARQRNRCGCSGGQTGGIAAGDGSWVGSRLGASESLGRVRFLGGQAPGLGWNQAPKTDRLNQVPLWEFRIGRKSFTPRQLAGILWDFTYLCWANPKSGATSSRRISSHISATARSVVGQT